MQYCQTERARFGSNFRKIDRPFWMHCQTEWSRLEAEFWAPCWRAESAYFCLAQRLHWKIFRKFGLWSRHFGSRHSRSMKVPVWWTEEWQFSSEDYIERFERCFGNLAGNWPNFVTEFRHCVWLRVPLEDWVHCVRSGIFWVALHVSHGRSCTAKAINTKKSSFLPLSLTLSLTLPEHLIWKFDSVHSTFDFRSFLNLWAGKGGAQVTWLNC